MLASRLSVITNGAHLDDDEDFDDEDSIDEFESPHPTPKAGQNKSKGSAKKASISVQKTRARMSRQRIPENLFEDESVLIDEDSSVSLPS